MKFDFLIMFFAIVNSFFVPLKVAFEPEFFYSGPVEITNSVIDFVFMCDVIMGFRTIFIDEFGEEISNPWKIAKNYVLTTFIFDLLASIPFDEFMAKKTEVNAGKSKKDNWVYIFSILKLFRLLRLKKLINYLQAQDSSKAIIRVMYIIFLLIIYLHCYSCIWWLLVRLE